MCALQAFTSLHNGLLLICNLINAMTFPTFHPESIRVVVIHSLHSFLGLCECHFSALSFTFFILPLTFMFLQKHSYFTLLVKHVALAISELVFHGRNEETCSF